MKRLNYRGPRDDPLAEVNGLKLLWLTDGLARSEQ